VVVFSDFDAPSGPAGVEGDAELGPGWHDDNAIEGFRRRSRVHGGTVPLTPTAPRSRQGISRLISQHDAVTKLHLEAARKRVWLTVTGRSPLRARRLDTMSVSPHLAAAESGGFRTCFRSDQECRLERRSAAQRRLCARSQAREVDPGVDLQLCEHVGADGY